MAIKVGTLQIDLVANTASFTGPMDKASQNAKKSAKDIQGAFNGMDFSDSRGGLILIDELIGVHIPRHAAAFASQIPGLMQIAAAALPIAAFGAIAVGIIDATEKLKQHKAELRNQAIEALASADAIHKHALSLEIENLKLEDSIRALEKLPKQNAILIAARQGQKALEDLRAELDQVLKSELGLFEPQTKGFLLTSFFDSFDDKNYKIRQSAEAMVSYFNDIQEAETKATLATREKREGDAKHFNDLKDQQIQKMLEMAQIDSASFEKGDDNARVYATKLRAVILAFGELKNVQDQVARGNKDTMTAAGLGQAVDAYTRVETKAKQSLEVQLAAIEDLRSKAIESFTSVGMKIDEARSKADAMFSGDTLQANLDYFARLTAAAATQADRDKIAADQQIFLHKQLTASRNQLAEAESQATELIQRRDDEAKKQSQALNDAMQKQQLASAAARMKALNEEINLKRGMSGEEARIAALQEVHSFQRIKDLGTELTALENIRKEQLRMGQDTTAVNAAIHTLQQKKLNDYANELMATGKLKDAMHATMLQMIADGQQWQRKIADTFKNTVGQMNSEMASFLVTGKANWRQLAATAIENFIEMGLQYVESKLLMSAIDKLFGVQKAGQNVAQAQSNTAVAATEALASVPWPLNIAAAAQTAAAGEAFVAEAAVGFFAKGGIVPDDMLAYVHQDEMVLPRDVSDTILNFTNQRGGGDTHTHFHVAYAPRINAVDASGVEQMLDRHGPLFIRKVEAHLRRRNF